MNNVVTIAKRTLFGHSSYTFNPKCENCIHFLQNGIGSADGCKLFELPTILARAHKKKCGRYGRHFSPVSLIG